MILIALLWFFCFLGDKNVINCGLYHIFVALRPLVCASAESVELWRRCCVIATLFQYTEIQRDIFLFSCLISPNCCPSPQRVLNCECICYSPHMFWVRNCGCFSAILLLFSEFALSATLFAWHLDNKWTRILSTRRMYASQINRYAGHAINELRRAPIWLLNIKAFI